MLFREDHPPLCLEEFAKIFNQNIFDRIGTDRRIRKALEEFARSLLFQSSLFWYEDGMFLYPRDKSAYPDLCRAEPQVLSFYSYGGEFRCFALPGVE